MTFDPSVPRWVRCVFRVADWLDYSVLSPLSGKLMFRYGFLDRHCGCVQCEDRRAKGLQAPRLKTMSQESSKESPAPAKRLDRQRLEAVVQETSQWPAYRRAELGTKAPSRVETKSSHREPNRAE